jgi:glyoxylase-like metal-dependent hydrolase (beta-lactamase superfamily II)
MFHHEASATLFSGDAILARRELTAPLRRFLHPAQSSLRLAASGFSQDVESCHQAVRKFLRRLPPTRCICSGHGPFCDESVEKELLRLA